MAKSSSLHDNVYLLSETEGAIRPAPHSLPWFVILTLGAYSKKHIFAGATLPNLKLIRDSGKALATKLKWAWKYRQQSSSSLPSLGISRGTPPFTMECPPELNWCETEIVNTLTAAHLEATNLARHTCNVFSRPRFVSACFRWLADHDLTAAQTDKDGIYVVVPNVVYNDLLCQQLKPSWYRPVFQSECFPRQMREHAVGLCKSLGHSVQGRVVQEIRNCAASSSKRSCFKVVCTIKTHKPVDEISMRVLHSSTGHMLNGFAVWVGKVLKAVLFHYTHCCTSSKQVITMLKSASINPGAILAKLDIKDFYMDTVHTDCVKNCVQATRDHINSGFSLPFVREDACFDHNLFGDVLHFLLTSQRIDTCQSPVAHEVIRGSGMGMAHSSAASSINFHFLVERSFVPLCPDVSGVLIYARYHDDIFSVCSDTCSARNLIETIKCKASSNYVIKVERVSTQWVTMLDITIFKSDSFAVSGKFSWRPFIKPTARHIPLSSESAHPEFVHESWPLAEINRMHFLLQSQSDFVTYKELKIQRFQQFAMPPHIIDKCREFQPMPCSQVARKHVLVPANKPKHIIRVILPFHAALARVLKYRLALANAHCVQMLNRWWPGAASVSFQVAWTNHFRPLHVLLR